MTDFRVKKVSEAAKELGFIVSYDEGKQMLMLDNCWHISFVDKRKVTINVICLEYPMNKEDFFKQATQVLNSQSGGINYIAISGYVIAAAEIDSISMMNSSFSMADNLAYIKTAVIAATSVLQKFV